MQQTPDVKSHFAAFDRNCAQLWSFVKTRLTAIELKGQRLQKQFVPRRSCNEKETIRFFGSRKVLPDLTLHQQMPDRS
eukprot:5341199-Amphidinium_carterae.1